MVWGTFAWRKISFRTYLPNCCKTASDSIVISNVSTYLTTGLVRRSLLLYLTQIVSHRMLVYAALMLDLILERHQKSSKKFLISLYKILQICKRLEWKSIRNILTAMFYIISILTEWFTLKSVFSLVKMLRCFLWMTPIRIQLLNQGMRGLHLENL